MFNSAKIIFYGLLTIFTADAQLIYRTLPLYNNNNNRAIPLYNRVIPSYNYNYNNDPCNNARKVFFPFTQNYRYNNNFDQNKEPKSDTKADLYLNPKEIDGKLDPKNTNFDFDDDKDGKLDGKFDPKNTNFDFDSDKDGKLDGKFDPKITNFGFDPDKDEKLDGKSFGNLNFFNPKEDSKQNSKGFIEDFSDFDVDNGKEDNNEIIDPKSPEIQIETLPKTELKPSFGKRRTITWHYIPRIVYRRLKKKYKVVRENGHFKRELDKLRLVFSDLHSFFPWLKFKESARWSTADIRFGYMNKAENPTLQAGRAYSSSDDYEVEGSNIKLGSPIWKEPKYQYPVMMHEVLHLLGLEDSDNVNSIMNNDGLAKSKIFYGDIKNLNKEYFKKSKKHLISFRKYKKLVKKSLAAQRKIESKKYRLQRRNKKMRKNKTRKRFLLEN